MSLIKRRIARQPWVVAVFLAACSTALADQPAPASRPAPPVAPKPAPTAPPAPLDPVKERAQQFRESAGLLEKAADALARGNKSFAEQLFSSAELIVGADAVAD